jgi:hypothetical protein
MLECRHIDDFLRVPVRAGTETLKPSYTKNIPIFYGLLVYLKELRTFPGQFFLG